MKRHFWIGTVVPLTKESDQSNLPHQSKLPHFMVFRTKNVLGSAWIKQSIFMFISLTLVTLIAT